MTLLQEIQAKCTAEQIAARDEAAIAALVNPDRTRTQKVAIADIQAYLQTEGIWLPLKAAAANTAAPAVQAPAQALLEAATARFENIDTTLPIVAQILDGLVSGGILTQAQMDAITAMGTVADPVSAYMVAVALEGI